MRKWIQFLCLLLSFGVLGRAQDIESPHAPSVVSPASFVDLSDLSATYPKDSSKPGYLIVTTGDLTHRLKSLQKFISHKANYRDFNVFVITEREYDQYPQRIIDAQQRGATYGRIRGKQILYYLRHNYERLNLKYVLFIGDARPKTGDTPMLAIAHHKPSHNIYGGYKMTPEEYDQLTDEQKAKHDERMKLTNPQTGLPLEGGSVISDYPYVDLDTDWDKNNDGFLDPKHDRVRNHTRRPEVYVGRLPYYGEQSRYGKAADMDVILERCIRYDREQNIAWRYNEMIEIGGSSMYGKIDFCEKHRINYQLFSRGKRKGIGMPSINSRSGGANIPNWQIVQDYGVGVYGNHSHGGPFGMEGFYSGHISKTFHDKWPTILSLGACYVGMISKDQNLAYTLLRFESVAVSGGTGGVTVFGGDMGSGEEAERIKNLYWNGASVGEKRWETYGQMYRNFQGVPWMTACKINIYGDPSAVPYRDGLTLPYSFFADPIMGKFGKFDVRSQQTDESADVTLENNKGVAVTVAVSTTKPWLSVDQDSVTLQPNDKQVVHFSIDREQLLADKPTDNGRYYRARMTFKDEVNGYETFRPFILKRIDSKLQNYYNFEPEDGCALDRVTQGKYRAKLNASESEALIDGVAGTAVCLTNANPSVPLYITDAEDATLSFWLKLNAVNRRQSVFKSNFVSLWKDKTDTFVLNVQDAAGKSAQSYSFETALDDGNWHHYLFSLQQSSGELHFYRDGQLFKTFSFVPNSICGAPGLFWSKIDGAMDEIVLYNQYKTAQQVQSIYQGYVVDGLYPRDNQHYLSNRNLSFETLKGQGIQRNRLVLVDADQQKTTYLPNSMGQFMVPEMAENTNYTWYVEGLTSDNEWVRSRTNRFTTAKELIANGSFEGDSKPWDGDCTIQTQVYITNSVGEVTIRKRAIRGEKSLRIQGIQSFSKIFPAALKGAETGYSFTAKGLYGQCARMINVSAFAVDADGTKELLASTAQLRDLALALQFRSRQDLTGKDLMLEIKQSSVLRPRDNWALFDEMSLVELPSDAINLAPKAVANANLSQYPTHVGEDGFAIHLNELFEDPEGSALTFSKLSGPIWADIQGDDLFSAFGPTVADDGKEQTFVVQASDEQGNHSQFSLKVQVGLTAPATPAGLTAQGDGHSRIKLDWSDNSEPNLGGYRVYRKLAGGENVVLAETNESAYEDRDVANGVEYIYQVAALNSAGLESPLSAEVSELAVIETVPPATPLHLSVAPDGSNAIELNWDANTEDDLAGYRIYRKAGSLDYTLLDTAASNHYVDSEYVLIGKEYTYKVTAYDVANNESGASNEGRAKLDHFTLGLSAADAVRKGVDPFRATIVAGNQADNVHVTITSSTTYSDAKDTGIIDFGADSQGGLGVVGGEGVDENRTIDTSADGAHKESLRFVFDRDVVLLSCDHENGSAEEQACYVMRRRRRQFPTDAPGDFQSLRLSAGRPITLSMSNGSSVTWKSLSVRLLKKTFPVANAALGMNRPAGAMVLSWPSTPGKTYSIWSKTDLTSGSEWVQEKRGIPAADLNTTHTDLSEDAPMKFYKVVGEEAE